MQVEQIVENVDTLISTPELYFKKNIRPLQFTQTLIWNPAYNRVANVSSY